MDVKGAFLYGTIEEEVYVCQPLGFEDLDYPDKVYKVVKVLYGLHQAPRAWYETLANYLLENDGKSASTPIDTEKPLLKDPDGEDVDVHIYSQKDFRYLKGKPHLGLWYPKDSPFNLVAYSSGDYPEDSLDRKSTTGGYQFLGCRLISWQCKKQTVVATSLTDAEYVAATSCCAQILWIQNQLLDYGNEAWAIPGQTATDKVCAVRPKLAMLVLIEAQHHISNESPLLGVNTPRCDEDSLAHMEFMLYVNAVWSDERCCSLHAAKSQVSAVEVFLYIIYVYKLSHTPLILQTLPLISPFLIITTIIMAPLTFADTNNMIVFLTKSNASEGFNQIVDFLTAHTIQYALLVNPIIYVSCIKQFWASVLIKKSNDAVKLQALIDRKEVIITEDTIHQAL
nr:uncharacterized mitochondrial protein AtMg00810-like [Tanacetum cinerariifolium]